LLILSEILSRGVLVDVSFSNRFRTASDTAGRRDDTESSRGEPATTEQND